MNRDRAGQLRRNFHHQLESVLAGEGLRTETGLDDRTDEALWAIVGAPPERHDELVAAAYRAFAGQLDGSNAAAWRAELARKCDTARE
ncbi:hypothetical protein [Kitasatospora viridis]|uniref:Uncharacterized protein n=1 Tax=Kitasatospora viridis TaxID=281105 RepID=A0A561UQ94_9ACTN|nr:hypothetical protein [Kitasatospora viridis]TWG01499.1 hypothetical protein FHX73_115400 [Kitasatospora viridis]